MERIVAAHNTSSRIELVKERTDIIYQEGVQYMYHAERKCRLITSGHIPFPPDSSVWIRLCQVYRFILRYHAEKSRNRSNLKRSDRRCGIGGLLQMSLKEVRDCLQVTHDKCK